MGRQNRRKEPCALQPEPWRFSARSIVVPLLLSLTVLLIYSNTFSAQFHFDDERNIVHNPWVHDLSHLLDLSGTRYVGLATFALNYHLGGLNVFGYHLVNLCIHIANGLLVYWLVLLLFRAVQDARPASVHWTALATALLFISHPIQTQAVTYIVQRLASLVTLFYLLSVVCYLKWRMQPPPPLRGGGWGAGDHPLPYPPPSRGRGRLWYVASLCATVIAMKTKENSFTIPLMILLVEVTFFRPFTKKRLATLIPLLLTLLTIPLFSGAKFGEWGGFSGEPMALSRLDYLFTQFRVIVTYLRLLVLPINQNVDYDYPTYHSLLHPEVFLSFIFLSSLLGFALYGLFRQRFRLAAFGILWFFLAISIESSIVPIQDVMFEHRAYLPSAGFFLAVSVILLGGRGSGTGPPRARAIWTIVGMGLVILVLGVATYQRNRVWVDPVTLWRDAVAKAPTNAKAHGNLGNALGVAGKMEEAVRESQIAIKLLPNYPQAHNNLGSALGSLGRLDEAIPEYEAALQLKPDYAEARNNLGNIYMMQGRIEEAIGQFEETLRRQPGFTAAQQNLRSAREKLGGKVNP